MQRLTVLFDPTCGLCIAAGRWLARQPAYLPLEFVAAGSREAQQRFPGVTPEETRAQLTVIGDDRSVWRGDRAFVMCLWALRRYRGWALSLARPGHQWLARSFFRSISKSRHQLSGLLGMTPKARTLYDPQNRRRTHAQG